MTNFSDLGLIDPLLKVLDAKGYSVPTPIQAKAIMPLLEGRDLMGIAQTGTGKTAAFGLPMLQRLTQSTTQRRPGFPRALVLAPTRELASQIADSFKAYSAHLPNIRGTVVFGGVGFGPQMDAMRRGVDIVVACPGRLLDLVQRRACDLSQVEILVLDEADRMFDMGFIHALKRIATMVPKNRQTLLFSATMPVAVAGLAKEYLNNPVRIEVTPQATTVEKIDQSVMHVSQAHKPALLTHLMQDSAIQRAIVFTRTKHGANRVAEKLEKSGVASAVIHGNKSQTQREKALASFRAGGLRVLVATDIASRGIDVRDITHVVNFDLPHEPEDYVHRIGRTARAGRSGIAIAFCAPEERGQLRAIERTTRQVLAVTPLPDRLDIPAVAPANDRDDRSQRFSRGGGGGRPQQSQQRRGRR